MRSIDEIKEIMQAASVEELPEIIDIYSTDERSGVQKLILSARKRIESLEKEKLRIEALREYEEKYTGSMEKE